MNAMNFTKEERLKRAVVQLTAIKDNAKAVFDEMEFLKRIGMPEKEVFEAHDIVFKKAS